MRSSTCWSAATPSPTTGLTFPDTYQRAERTRLDGVDDVPVTVISLADLRRNERAAGRAKDLADLEGLPEG